MNADDAPEFPDAFVVYQGHHGDAGAHSANVILPGCAYTEKGATFVNTEGRAQVTRAAVPPPGEAREDWSIIRALSQVLGTTLPYDDLTSIRRRMFTISPTLVDYDVVQEKSFTGLGLGTFNGTAKGSFKGFDGDFYLTDPIARASSTMAKCSVAFTKGENVEQVI